MNNTKWNAKGFRHVLWLLPIVLLILGASVPIMMGTGLNTPEPVAPYLNNNFPPNLNTSSVAIEDAFPNLTFNSPLTWTMHPNDEVIFLGQRDGVIYYFDNNQNAASKVPFLDISSQVGLVWDGGFLGMAMHPNFGVPGTQGRNYFYVFYATRDGNGGHEPTSPVPQPCEDQAQWFGGYLVLSRWEVNEGTLTVKPDSELEMIKVRLYNSTHRGGGMLFGQDGFLYLTTGDQAEHNPAQRMEDNLDGGVLRLDVDMDPSRSHAPIYTMPQDPRGPDEISGVGYWIPNDNPFLSPGGGRFEEYFSLGHRNPHRMTMDPMTGTMYIGEIGSNVHEEINILQKGKNYGWPVWEGSVRKNTCVNQLYSGTSHTLPLVAFPRSEANSIIGGYVYRGTAVPDLYGKYICGDYGSGEEVWAVDTQTGTYELMMNFAPRDIISFGQDHDGEIYILKQGDNVKIYKFKVPGPGDILPPLLSQTGAFADLATLTPNPGIIPYDLVEPFWSDGALKRRWMVIPNDGTHDTAAEQIMYSEEGEWQFPIGAVLIKHFELPIDENNPNITKRLETRFSVRDQDGRFYFATYKWRADGSDADLLTTGLDEDIVVNSAGGPVTQTWHYPSPTECLTCHNDALGGTLGPRTRYLNKNITYPATNINANQLVTLSHLGILNANITDASAANLLTAVAKDDPNASLEFRARSYLDLNCGYCHRPQTGNRAVFDARLSTPLEASNYFSAQLNESLGITGERIIAPADLTKSVLYQRLHSTDPTIMMPPLAKSLIDEEGAQLIADWILSLDPNLNFEDRGLQVVYYDNIDFTGPTVTGVDNIIDFNWGTGSPDPSIAVNTFSARWTGYLEAPTSGAYTFYTRTDDGVRLWVNDQLIIDQWINQAPTEVSAILSMTAGQRVPVKMEYFENGGGAVAQLSWSGPNVSKQIIPNNHLFTDAEGGCSGLQNVALGKSASQSSTYPSAFSFGPENAVDGDNNGDDAGNAMTHTLSDQNAWWEVDLGSVHELSSIKIWNRSDCCSARLADFHVLVSDDAFDAQDLQSTINQSGVSDFHFPGIPGRETDISLNRTGQYIRIQLSDNNFLQLAEVEVMGCQNAPVPSSQTITFPALVDRLTTDGPFEVAATASSGLPVSFEVVSGPGSINGNTITLSGAPGTVVVSASQAGNDDFLAAPNVQRSFAVVETPSGGCPTIDFVSNPVQSYGGSQDKVTSTVQVLDAGSTVAIANNGWKSIDYSYTVTANTVLEFDFQSTQRGEIHGIGFDNNGSITQEYTFKLYGSQNWGLRDFDDYTGGGYKTYTINVGNYYTGSFDRLFFSNDHDAAPGNADSYFRNIKIYEGTCDEIPPDPCAAEGQILMERWDNIGGGVAVNLIPLATAPTAAQPLNTFEIPINTGDNYGARVRGYICAPQTGAYTFWVSGDDNAELWLSTDADPANKRRIAHVPGWTTSRQWNKYPEQSSSAIDLTAGETYYVEALVKEQSGGDNLAVGWTLPDGTEERPMSGTQLSPWIPSAQCTASGQILMESWNNIGGGVAVSLVPVSTTPSTTQQLNSFEIPVNSGDNYGARVRGYICPPQTGDYTFWISSDDNGELWLSTDEDPANRQRIAHVPGWTSSRLWTKYPEQASVPINLTAGQSYYIEAIVKEQLGGDNLAVGWSLPDGTVERPISGQYLSPASPQSNILAQRSEQSDAPIAPEYVLIDQGVGPVADGPEEDLWCDGPELHGEELRRFQEMVLPEYVLRAYRTASEELNVPPSIPLGLPEETFEFKVYPNPATQKEALTIAFTQPQAGRLQLQLINQYGQVVVRENRTVADVSGFFRLEVVSLPPGVYFVLLKGEDYQREGKVVVQ